MTPPFTESSPQASPALSSFLRSNFRDKEITSIVDDRIRSPSCVRLRRREAHQAEALTRSVKSCNAIDSSATSKWVTALAKDSTRNAGFNDEGLQHASRFASITAEQSLYRPSRRASITGILNLPILKESHQLQ
ncbi:unnamed protein product [Cylindrotheca closterium]|uniref:Uncharacterized protein n=1 Tax=Cylindrotheca closterium TaxID=2856 RepID=A0AAD2PU10_9STRA|nr:unnamed protein product [Cylindrotheca closterium]